MCLGVRAIRRRKRRAKAKEGGVGIHVEEVIATSSRGGSTGGYFQDGGERRPLGYDGRVI
jgi:hypothetical protein